MAGGVAAYACGDGGLGLGAEGPRGGACVCGDGGCGVGIGEGVNVALWLDGCLAGLADRTVAEIRLGSPIHIREELVNLPHKRQKIRTPLTLVSMHYCFEVAYTPTP